MSRAGKTNSYVDDSLWGHKATAALKETSSKSPAKGGSPSRPGATGRGTATASKLDVVALKKSDLDRMMAPPLVLTQEDISKAKMEATAKREELQAVSKARKEKMIRLAEEAKMNAAEDESTLIKRQADGETLTRAQKLLLEQKDEVKRMNQMILYSKCVTIRDAQIEEKRRMIQDNEKEERQQDLAMEIERVRALEQYEARERQREVERRRGAKTIEVQIAERERLRALEGEKRTQERTLMLKEIERLKEAELTAQIGKRLQAQELMVQVAAANAEQIHRKEEVKHREKEEDARIAAYIRSKEMREQEVLAQKERVAQEKEMETARLRAMQERAADKQSEMDELRARRYQESKEREWRNKERAQVEKQSALQRDLQGAREAQQNARVRQQAEMAQVEHNEFMRVLAVNRAKEQEDMMQTASQLTINEKYKEELLAQIRANEERDRRARLDLLEEGSKVRKQQQVEAARLAEIKAAKLQTLEAIGVPAKYRAELERMKLKG